MPYIKPEDRELYKPFFEALSHVAITTAGELNFLLTQLVLQYMKDKPISYATYNNIVGALECCKQEFIRRKVSPYEDEKIKENGDVYTGLYR